MAEPGLDGLDVDAVGEEQCGLRVPELVELEPVEAMLLAPDTPPVAELSMRMRPPVLEQHTGVSSVCLTQILASSSAWRSFHMLRWSTVVGSMAMVRTPESVFGVLTTSW